MSAAQQIQVPVQFLELKSVRESPLNPRKTFDEKALAELAGDVAVHGVMQAILVRPVKDELYEVIFGARRLRAAKLAKLESIPALVVEMDDAHALERMIVENCQRQDVPFLEEAEGFKAMLEHGFTAEQIAEKVGKSRAHVYARIQITKLTAKARKGVEDLGLGAEHALLLARIPDETRQLEALARIGSVHHDYQTNESLPMGIRQATRWVKDHYMLALAGAPFDTKDEELVKEAGPCTTCPFRTTNAPDLFSDIGKGDLCTKPSCFAEKKAAAWRNERKEAKDKGLKVLSEAESKEVLDPYGQGTRSGAAFVRLNDTCEADPKRRTWKQLAGKSAPKPSVVARDAKGDVVQLVPREDLVTALEARGHDFAKAAAKREENNGPDYEARYQQRQAQQEKKRKEKLAVAWRAMGRVIEKVERSLPDRKFWRLMIEYLLVNTELETYERRGWPEDENAKDRSHRLDRMSEGELRGFCFELIVGPDAYSTYRPVELAKICREYGVDIGKEREAMKKEAYEAKKAAEAEARAKDEAAKPTSCAVPGCKRPLKSKGLCGAHYSAVQRRKAAKA